MKSLSYADIPVTPLEWYPVSVIQFSGLAKPSPWMWSERGEWIAVVCVFYLLLSSAWQGNSLGVQNPNLEQTQRGLLCLCPTAYLYSVPPTEMHWHPYWEGVLGTCRWWEGHLQLLGLAFLLAIIWLCEHSASRYVMERTKVTELHSSHPAAIWTSLFNVWDQDSISQSQIYIRTAQDWYISSM